MDMISSTWQFITRTLFPPVDAALRDFFVGPPPPPPPGEFVWDVTMPMPGFAVPTLGGTTTQEILPHPIGEFFMTPLQYPLDAVGLGVQHPVLFYFALIASFGLWCFALRTAWIIPARRLGLYNPNHYHLFPRLPWRLLYEPFDMLRDHLNLLYLGKRSTARLAGPFEVAAHLYKPGKTLLGRMMAFNLPGLMPVGVSVKRHLMMVADTGGGKTTTLTSLLALHRGNAFVIDPNGQVAHTLLARCGAGGDGIIGKRRKVAVLDPKKQVAGVVSAAWNPFDELHAVAKSSGEEMVQDVAWKMAAALIVTDSESQKFWSNAARQFSYALILYIYANEARENQTLLRWRELLCNGLKPPSAERFAAVADDMTPGDVPMPQPYQWLLHCMESSSKFQNAIRNATGPVRAALKIDREGQLTSSAEVQTTWMDFEHVETILGRSDFSFEELKSGDLTLFVCAPLADVRDTMTAWFRLLTVMALDTFERLPGRPNPPTLFAIDELPALGHLESLATAPVTLRKYGGQLLGVTQDIGMLKKTYPGTWESFLSSADATYWMNVDHSESVAYLSAKLGERTRKTKVRDPGGKKRIQLEDRPVMDPKDIVKYVSPKRGRMLVTVKDNSTAFRLKVPHYFKELPVYYYAPDPNEDESPLRELTRAFFRLFRSRIVTETDTATKPFDNRGLAWRWLEERFNCDNLVSIGANLFERLNPEQPLCHGTVFSITSNNGIQRQARLDVWDSHEGHALLTFLDPKNQPWRTHEYTLTTDDDDEHVSQLNVEIKTHRYLGFWDFLYSSVFDNMTGLAKIDLGLPLDAEEQSTELRKLRDTDFGYAARGPIEPVTEPICIATPLGTFINNQNGTVTYIDGGLVFMGAPWGTVYKDGRFVGDQIKLSQIEAVKLFGRGPDMNTFGAQARGDEVPPTNRERFKPGTVRVTLGGHSDWRLATAPELALLGMVDPRTSSGFPRPGVWGEDDASRKAREALFPYFSGRKDAFELWSANGTFCLDNKWPLTSDDILRRYGVLLVRNDPQAALNSATFMNSAIAIPRMPNLLFHVLSQKRKNLRGHWHISKGDTVVVGQTVLSYGHIDVFAPVAGRITATGSCDPASSWDTERGWPDEEDFLFVIQPIDGSRLIGTVPRAWAQLIAWCNDVLGWQRPWKRPIPDGEAVKEELLLLEQAEHRVFRKEGDSSAPPTATDFWDVFDECFHPERGSFSDIKGREKINGLMQRPESEDRTYDQLRSLLRTICTRKDPLLHEIWEYADRNIPERRAG